MCVAERLVYLFAVDGVAEVVEEAVGHVGDEGLLLVLEPHDVDEPLGDLHVGHLVGAPDVVDLPHLALEEHELKGARHVRHVQEVPGVGPRAV